MSISVLMSVYYKENPDNLNQALESVWDKQTYKPEEIILVQDGPLTNSLYIVLDYWESKVGIKFRRICLNKNQGLTKALNVGIEICSKEFIARMDSDDISAPQRFEKQRKFLQDHPEIDLIGGTIQEFSKNVEKICTRTFPIKDIDVKKYIAKASPLVHGTVMFRKRIFDSGIRYNERYRYSQDIDLWFTLIAKNFKISNITDVTYHVRVSDDFFSRRSSEKARNEFMIYWKGILKTHGLSFKLVFPILRLLFRFTPKSFVKYLYSSDFRGKLLSSN